MYLRMAPILWEKRPARGHSQGSQRHEHDPLLMHKCVTEVVAAAADRL